MPDFFLTNSVFQHRHFSNTLSRNAGVIGAFFFFFLCVFLSLFFFCVCFVLFCCCPEYLKEQVNFNAIQRLSHHERHTCMFVQTGNRWNITCFIGTTANNQTWNENWIFWKDHFDQQFLFKIAEKIFLQSILKHKDTVEMLSFSEISLGLCNVWT